MFYLMRDRSEGQLRKKLRAQKKAAKAAARGM
jgi:hypothetical protein